MNTTNEFPQKTIEEFVNFMAYDVKESFKLRMYSMTILLAISHECRKNTFKEFESDPRSFCMYKSFYGISDDVTEKDVIFRLEKIGKKISDYIAVQIIGMKNLIRFLNFERPIYTDWEITDEIIKKMIENLEYEVTLGD